MPTSPEPRHGTAGRYATGCRCPSCRRGHNLAGQRQRAADLRLLPDLQPHGEPNTYSQHGCRCEQCKAVMARLRHDARLAAKDAALADLMAP